MSDELNFLLHLPEDVSTYILLKLPTKSLLTCTCVCKSWSSFIKSPSFFKSHLQTTISSNKRNDSDRCLLQLCSLPVQTGTDRFLLISKDQKLNLCEEIHFPHQEIPCRGFQVLASSCNGLVLLMQWKFHVSGGIGAGKHLFLWNPVIRKSISINVCPYLYSLEQIVDFDSRIPEMYFLEAIGLGFDSRTSDYKLLTFTEVDISDGSLHVHLYSLKANAWKRLPDIEVLHQRRGNIHRAMVYLNEALYFVASRGWHKEPRFYILGFDLSDEVFREIVLPDCIASDCGRLRYLTSESFYLWNYRESLAISRFNHGFLNIWAMKEPGVELEGSWTLLSTINLRTLEFGGRMLTTGLVFIDDSRVILSFGSPGDEAGLVFLHDLKSQETKKIGVVEEGNNCFFLGDYVESLVLLDKGNELTRFIQQQQQQQLLKEMQIS